MGIETAIIVGLTAASISANNRQAKKDAKSVTNEARQQAEAEAKDTSKAASAAKVSFLNSGFTMEGTPELSIMGILDAGQADINTIKSNADSKSKQIIGAARAKALSSIASAGTSMYVGGAFDGAISSATFGTGSMNGFGQAVGSGFSSNQMGPFLPYGRGV